MTETNAETQQFFDLFAEGKSIFLTGKAGTGKSTIIRKLIESNKKNCLVVASTGIAAVNIGGVTIHSFFQLPLRPLMPNDAGITSLYASKRKIIAEMKTLIVDEVSMVRADTLDAIDASLRKNGGNPKLAFGGKQIILVGDMFQLEPITKKDSTEFSVLQEFYPNSTYFFEAYGYKNLKPEVVELKKVYRQTDEQFLTILNRVRVGEQTETDLEILNDRHEPSLPAEDFTIELATTNAIADQRNFSELAKINSAEYRYAAVVEGKFDENRFPAPQTLLLKIGAQVVFLRNDSNRRWINGTIGKIAALNPETVTVLLPNGKTHDVEKSTWENIEYQFDRMKGTIASTPVGKFTQYPLKLAWSITIHKSQGLTFEKVYLNFGNGAFAAGQAYVALSRCTTLSGLRLQTKLTHKDIIVNERVKEWY